MKSHMRKIIILACLTSLLSCMALPSFALETTNVPDNAEAFGILNNNKIRIQAVFSTFDDSGAIGRYVSNIYTDANNNQLKIHVPFPLNTGSTIIGCNYLDIGFIFSGSNFNPNSNINTQSINVYNYSLDFTINVDNVDLFYNNYPNQKELLSSVITYTSSYIDNKIATTNFKSFDKNERHIFSNTSYNNVSYITLRLPLFNYPGHIVYLGGYNITVSNFIINNTDVYFESELNESNNLTQSMDTKLENLTQSITVPEPNYNNINKSYDNAFNNIDTVATSTLFNWTSNPLVITILTMVASFGVLSYILFGKKG